MTRQRFLGALCALIGVGTVNPALFDSNDDSGRTGQYISMEEMKFSPATPGDYKVNEKLVFYTHPDFLRTEKIYAPYVPLYTTRL